MNEKLKSNLIVSLPASLRHILTCLNENALGLVFMVDENEKLIGVISDGDIRRDFLKESFSIDTVINASSTLFNSQPIYLNYGATLNEIWSVFERGIDVVPILDKNYKIVDCITRDNLGNIPILAPSIGAVEASNILSCLESGWISSQGKFIQEFEADFTDYLGGGYSLAVSNGTVALHLALVTMGVGAGDEVIVPDFTFAASINAIIHAGATPILADIDINTWTIDATQILKYLSPKTKAIMPVHLYGQACHMDELMSIASDNNLHLIEDCAESLGAKYKNRMVGLDGDCSCYSFFANKVITTGEGGMINFRDPKKYNHAKILRDHGMNPSKKYWHDYVGFNYRMTNLQAAIGVAQLSRLGEFRKKRSEIFDFYRSRLLGNEHLSLIPFNTWSENSFWLFTVFLKNFGLHRRDKLIERMGYRGIDTRPGFSPLHQMPPYQKFSRGDYPNSVLVSENTLSLPSSSDLTKSDLEYICSVLLDELAR